MTATASKFTMEHDLEPPATTDALLLDAHMRQMLVAARSLGGAGLRVTLAESFAEWSPQRPVPAFSSRFAGSTLTLPDHLRTPELFARALLAHLDRHPTRVLIPGSDGVIAALRPHRPAIERVTRLALASEAALDLVLDKDRTLALAAGLGIETPATVAIPEPRKCAAVLARLGYPAVLKPSTPFGPSGRQGRLRGQVVSDEASAVVLTQRFLDDGARVLAQEFVGGRRETVKFFLVAGEVHAEFAQVSHRMTPVLGGASVASESVAMPADLRSRGLRLVRAAGVDGYCEVEFRRDMHGRPRLMEVNARLSGSMEVPRRAGVDFPRLLWQWAAGLPVDRCAGYRAGVRVRWLRGDYAWLRENLAGPATPDSLPPARALRVFGSEFLKRSHYDYVDASDLGPVRAELRAAMKAALSRRPSPASGEQGTATTAR